MFRLFGLDRLIRLVIRKTMMLWVRTQVMPHDWRSLGIDPNKPICYVLQSRLLPNVLVLESVAMNLGMPRPLASTRRHGLREKHSILCLT